MPPHSSKTELPPRPQPPQQHDCCKGDCAPNCVFDVYERELERWQQARESLHDTGGSP